MSTNTILFGVLFFLMALAIFVIVRIEIRLKRLFRGSKAENLEHVMADVVKSLQALDERATANEADVKELNVRLQKQGRGIKLVRFNPFKEVGGSHSFAVAIVNEEGDGVVFSSLYSRERMSVFAKPLAKGKSDVELTPEEESVAKDAQNEANQ